MIKVIMTPFPLYCLFTYVSFALSQSGGYSSKTNSHRSFFIIWIFFLSSGILICSNHGRHFYSQSFIHAFIWTSKTLGTDWLTSAYNHHYWNNKIENGSSPTTKKKRFSIIFNLFVLFVFDLIDFIDIASFCIRWSVFFTLFTMTSIYNICTSVAKNVWLSQIHR